MNQIKIKLTELIFNLTFNSVKPVKTVSQEYRKQLHFSQVFILEG